ncbi:bacterioferritin [Methylococcus sp. EFPC2]|uniref:bacterioferritin n=1 Tax=Methylococcus sp. EFPC2 TaxID=2812648 RepID=UPI0019682D4D|nr:bacterioferritin [Methylococcus sp. EFPC2]QSA98594.1 bacterioferritin [Methylococcus sp. EFPC2]
MKGNPQVIDHLNRLLAGELTAIDQYFIHSRKFHDWGLDKLYTQIDHEMAEERGHADLLINRILFLEGHPDLATRAPLNEGDDVPGILRNDLALEHEVVVQLREVMAFCESVQDYETRDILLKLLKDTEEDHTWWLEKQLRLIDTLGLPNYLQSQI